jgi:hypothetical protein
MPPVHRFDWFASLVFRRRNSGSEDQGLFSVRSSGSLLPARDILMDGR